MQRGGHRRNTKCANLRINSSQQKYFSIILLVLNQCKNMHLTSVSNFKYLKDTKHFITKNVTFFSGCKKMGANQMSLYRQWLWISQSKFFRHDENVAKTVAVRFKSPDLATEAPRCQHSNGLWPQVCVINKKDKKRRKEGNFLFFEKEIFWIIMNNKICACIVTWEISHTNSKEYTQQTSMFFNQNVFKKNQKNKTGMHLRILVFASLTDYN